MKYLFFVAALAGIAPATLLMLCDRRWIRWGTLGLSVPILVFDSTAINFLSHELYRGTSRGMEISLIYIVAVSLLLTFTILGKRVRLMPDMGSVIYICYFFCCLPSLLNAESVLFSFFELWKMCMIYLVFLAVYHYLDYSHGDYDILLYGIAWVVGYNFFLLVIQHYQGVYQARGVFPHQNSMAMYMMMAGTLFFSRAFNCREHYRSWIFLLAFILSSVLLVRTYSRGALFCYPICGLLTMFCSYLRGFSLRKFYLSNLLLIVAMIGLLLFLPRIIQRFETAPKSSGQTRKNLAIAALNMIQDKPVAGVGLNNWGIKINPPYDYSRHRDPKKGFTDDHKDGIVETIYLLVAAECGIPCFILLLTWFGYYWVLSIRLLWRFRHSRYFYLPAGSFGALTGVYLQSSLEWVLKQQINFMWLMIFFAFLGYLNRNSKELLTEEEKARAALQEALAEKKRTKAGTV